MTGCSVNQGSARDRRFSVGQGRSPVCSHSSSPPQRTQRKQHEQQAPPSVPLAATKHDHRQEQEEDVTRPTLRKQIERTPPAMVSSRELHRRNIATTGNRAMASTAFEPRRAVTLIAQSLQQRLQLRHHLGVCCADVLPLADVLTQSVERVRLRAQNPNRLPIW